MAKPKTLAPSLIEDFRSFAAKHRRRPGPPCFICSLPTPLRAAVEQVWDEGARATNLRLWLIEKGYDSATKNRIDHHFSSGHRERES